MTNTAVISTEKLTKFYGTRQGVVDLDLEVRPAEVFGFLGPNGAGKTTTIRLLMGFLRPTRGTVQVLGRPVSPESSAVHRDIGYLPGDLALYENLTGRELLTYFANLRGGVDWPYVTRLAERLDLDLGTRIRTLSKGNKQKVGVIQALMSRPQLLILDEPTSGLDPLVQQEFNALIREARADGRTVFLSSHVLSEVERIADRVCIIREGRLVVVEEIRALKARALRKLDLEFAGAVPAEVFERIPGVRVLWRDQDTIKCSVEGPVDVLIKAAGRFELLDIRSHEPDLEEIFLAYYQRPAGPELATVQEPVPVGEGR